MADNQESNVTSKLYLSTREKWAKDAIVSLMTDFAEGQHRTSNSLDSVDAEAAHLENSLDRAIQSLMTAAREPLEDRLQAQEQEIRDLKDAVELLQGR